MNQMRIHKNWTGENSPGEATAAKTAAMATTTAATMKAVERALAQSPALHIPGDFAARVAAQAVTQPALQRVSQRVSSFAPPASFGFRLALASGVLLTGALFALAPHATPSFANLRFDLELLLLSELGGIGFLLTQAHLRE